MNSELVSGAHIKYQATYHLQWVTKYRYKIFQKEKYRYDYENILRVLARVNRIELLEIAVMPYHIHVITPFSPTFSISKIFWILKGISSRQFFLLHPEFKLRYPKGHLFSPGKFARTVGSVDLATTRKYVKDQALQKTLVDFNSKSK